MNKLEKSLRKIVVWACAYLLALLLLLIITTSVFDMEELHFPAIIEWFFKITIGFAIVSVITSGMALPVMKLLGRKPVLVKWDPVLVAANTFLVGLGLIFIQALYVRLQSCAVDDIAWHCNIDGKSYVGLLLLLFFASVFIGAVTWLLQKLKKKS